RYNNGLIPQGPSSDLMNDRFDISREDLDAFSERSHLRAAAATAAGRFASQMVPLTEDPDDLSSAPVTTDEGIRQHPDREKMASLRSAFSEG
ncbi:steroid 3-ketoacyl-CoA thiolase, partial [Klebsiella aerogenes]|nr:steroid 3-ketoacyl-CoA thiolase [Klebsiella aerogenes]